MNRVVGDILKEVKIGAPQTEGELLAEEDESSIEEVASKVC